MYRWSRTVASQAALHRRRRAADQPFGQHDELLLVLVVGGHFGCGVLQVSRSPEADARADARISSRQPPPPAPS